MEITSQDIIDKEFRVKFRGFDMAEVDSFLEEVAENFFKLTEENTLLNEKILDLQRDLEAGSASSATPVELPAELGGLLEDLKQDTVAIGAELVSLKQDRQALESFKKGMEKIATSIQESRPVSTAGQSELHADLAATLEEIRKGSGALSAELAALKEERQVFVSLKKNLEEAVAAAQQAVKSVASQGQAEVPADLAKTLEHFKKGSETVGAELAALKDEVAALSQVRVEMKSELQEMLASHFSKLDAKLAAMGDVASGPAPEVKAAPAAPGKKAPLPTARIEEEPAGIKEDTRLPDYEEQDDVDDDSDLEFLSEDDLLDVDKLRGVFQSVLDDTFSDSHNSRDGDESSADLFLKRYPSKLSVLDPFYGNFPDISANGGCHQGEKIHQESGVDPCRQYRNIVLFSS